MSEKYIPKSQRDKKVAKEAEVAEGLEVTGIVGLAWVGADKELGMWDQKDKDKDTDKPTYLWKEVPAVFTLSPIPLESFNCDSEQLSINFSKPVRIERMQIGKDARIL